MCEPSRRTLFDCPDQKMKRERGTSLPPTVECILFLNSEERPISVVTDDKDTTQLEDMTPKAIFASAYLSQFNRAPTEALFRKMKYYLGARVEEEGKEEYMLDRVLCVEIGNRHIETLEFAPENETSGGRD